MTGEQVAVVFPKTNAHDEGLGHLAVIREHFNTAQIVPVGIFILAVEQKHHRQISLGSEVEGFGKVQINGEAIVTAARIPIHVGTLEQRSGFNAGNKTNAANDDAKQEAVFHAVKNTKGSAVLHGQSSEML